MPFHVLSPELLHHLLKGEEDVLTSRQTARIDKIKRTPCPRCGASLHPKLHTAAGFGDDGLPRMLGTCECGFVQDEDTGLIIDRGSAAKVQDPLPIVGRGEK